MGAAAVVDFTQVAHVVLQLAGAAVIQEELPRDGPRHPFEKVPGDFGLLQFADGPGPPEIRQHGLQVRDGADAFEHPEGRPFLRCQAVIPRQGRRQGFPFGGRRRKARTLDDVEDHQLAGPQMAGPVLRRQVVQERGDAVCREVEERPQAALGNGLQHQFVVAGPAGEAQGIGRFAVGQAPRSRLCQKGALHLLRQGAEGVAQQGLEERMKRVGPFFIVEREEGRAIEQRRNLFAAQPVVTKEARLADGEGAEHGQGKQQLPVWLGLLLEVAAYRMVQFLFVRVGHDLVVDLVDTAVIARRLREGEHFAFLEFVVGDGRVQVRDFPVHRGPGRAAAVDDDAPFVGVQDHAVRGVCFQETRELGQPQVVRQRPYPAFVPAHLRRDKLLPGALEARGHFPVSIRLHIFSGPEPRDILRQVIQQRLHIRMREILTEDMPCQFLNSSFFIFVSHHTASFFLLLKHTYYIFSSIFVF